MQRYENSQKLAFVAGFKSHNAKAAESKINVSYNWEFICGRINAEKISIHVNGVDQTDPNSWTSSPYINGDTLKDNSGIKVKIGGDGSGNHGYLISSIDEVKVYNVALSDSQIMAKYLEYTQD